MRKAPGSGELLTVSQWLELQDEAVMETPRAFLRACYLMLFTLLLIYEVLGLGSSSSSKALLSNPLLLSGLVLVEEDPSVERSRPVRPLYSMSSWSLSRAAFSAS